MGLMGRMFGAGKASNTMLDAQALMLAPAAFPMLLANKSIKPKIEALADACEITQCPKGMSRLAVMTKAAQVLESIRSEGVPSVMDMMQDHLSHEQHAEATRLALVAVMLSPARDDYDFGVLSGAAGRLGFGDVQFDQMYETAKETILSVRGNRI